MNQDNWEQSSIANLVSAIRKVSLEDLQDLTALEKELIILKRNLALSNYDLEIELKINMIDSMLAAINKEKYWFEKYFNQKRKSDEAESSNKRPKYG